METVMSELEKWTGAASGGLLPRREERAHGRAVAKLVNQTKLEGLRVDAEAALTGRIMERAVELDNYRKSLAGNDPVLDALLTRIELGFIDKAARIQHNFGSVFFS